MQMRLLQQRAVVTQYSRTRLVETRKIITRQMQELDEMLENSSSKNSGIDAEVLKGYLQELETSAKADSLNRNQSGQNEAGYRGRYCRDILTDEVLSQISDYAEAHGNNVTISIRNYETGRSPMKIWQGSCTVLLMQKPEGHPMESANSLLPEQTESWSSGCRQTDWAFPAVESSRCSQ